MEKLIFFVYRLPHLSRTEFCERYLEEHTGLVRQHCSRLRRYAIDLIESSAKEGDASFDAVAHMWLDAVEDFTDRSRFYDTPEAHAEVRAHAEGMVRAAVGYHVAETVQRDYDRDWADGERSPGVKMIAPINRLDGISHDEFEKRWLHTHAPLALEHVPGIWRYVTNVVLEPISRGAPELDGIVEVHRRSIEDLKLRPSPESQAIMNADTDALIVRPARNKAGEHIIIS